MRIFTDHNAYRTVQRVRGVPDKNKPNSRRPWFYKVKVRIPLAYLLKAQNAIFAAPEIVAKLNEPAKDASPAPGILDYAPPFMPSLFQRPILDLDMPDDQLNFRFRYRFGADLTGGGIISNSGVS